MVTFFYNASSHPFNQLIHFQLTVFYWFVWLRSDCKMSGLKRIEWMQTILRSTIQTILRLNRSIFAFKRFYHWKSLNSSQTIFTFHCLDLDAFEHGKWNDKQTKTKMSETILIIHNDMITKWLIARLFMSLTNYVHQQNKWLPFLWILNLFCIWNALVLYYYYFFSA